MLDALQYDRLGGAVDTADRAPVSVPNPHPILLAAQWPSRAMWPEGIGGEGLDPGKQREPFAPR